VIASFVSGPGSSTLPMIIFSKTRLGVSPAVNAMGTLLVGTIAVGIVGWAWFGRRNAAAQKRP